MSEPRTSTMSNGWLWMGAAISISGILAGTLIAPLGWQKGLLSILVGRIIGGIFLYFAGYIGAQTRMKSMDTIKISFGQQGGIFFAVLNVLQLVGWTAVMVVNAAGALNAMMGQTGTQAIYIGSAIVGGFIFIWVMLNVKLLAKVNSATVIALMLLCLVLTYKAFTGNPVGVIGGEMTFSRAVELSIAMPVSWVPVIADYTSKAKHPMQANRISNISYFFGGAWMFIIGMAAAIITGIADVPQIMSLLGVGMAGLLIIVFSTVTTTYLDAVSAAISFRTIFKVLTEKKLALIVTVVGTLIACFVPITYFGGFLYLIGSCFTPMIAILVTDYFLLKRVKVTSGIDWINLIIWLVGFVIYRIFLALDLVVGASVPAIVLVILITYVVNRNRKKTSVPLEKSV